MLQHAFAIVTVLALALGIPATGFAQGGGPYIPTVDLSSLRLPQPETVTGVAPELRTATGEVGVVVRLVGAPLAEIHAADQGALSDSARREQRKALDQKQDTLVNGIQRHGGRPMARLNKAINAVVIGVDASQLDAIAKLPDVQGIRPLGRYTVHLGETVPYIGAAAVQQTGYDGSGISVAVLDTGLDYLHRNLGGSSQAGFLVFYRDVRSQGEAREISVKP